MDATRQRKAKKGNLIVKTWERCKSLSRGGGSGGGGSVPRAMMMKSKSWPRVGEGSARKRRVAPEGCFTVYVGPQRQRFVVKTEYANHPLFKMLLEEAESEYGFCSAGPISLPCNVDYFWKVLLEMDGEPEIRGGSCGFARSRSAYRILTPSPMVALNRF